MLKSIQAIISSLCEFKSMPESIGKIISLFNDPGVTELKIKDILRNDADIMNSVLELTNASYFGCNLKIDSINNAVAHLGLKRVVHIITISCLNSLMKVKIDGYGFPPGELFRHSIAVFIATELLVKELQLNVPEETSTAALFHDIGKLALGDLIEDEINEINKQIKNGGSYQKAEKKVFGIDHAEIGSKILERWTLPESMVNAVRWHHNPDFVDNTDLMVDIIHVADALCLMIGIGVGRKGLMYEPSKGATLRLGVKHSHLEMVASQTLQISDELHALYCSN